MKQKGLWLSLFCVTLLLERVVGQCTSSVERQVCGAGNLEQQACTSNGCCYEASREPKCFINVEAVNPAQALTILQELPTPPAIENVDAVKRVASQVGARVDTSVSDSIEERALTFGTSSLLGLTLNFPVCPVNVPICHRTKCNSLNPLSESNPLICYQDPRCCFDKDLYVHKAIFGQQYMSDAPVCHYGPTSSRYVDITRLIVPWNPFYQEAVIKIFDSVFNNAINYQQQAVCAFTVAISVIAKQCGWESITKKECQLVGCCYDDTRKYCAYPQQNVLANFNIQEYYPELIARPGESTTCPSSNGNGLLGGLSGLGGVGLPGLPGPGFRDFNPSMFNRLPCQSTNTTTVFNTLLTCPSIGCCINTMAFLPGISGLTSGTLGAGVFCPFFYFRIPGLPDLTLKVKDCCKLQACYHPKQIGSGIGPGIFAFWGIWSDYGTCSGGCGTIGQQIRSRTCTYQNGQIADGRCGDQTTDSRTCNLPVCANWLNWGPFGLCQGTCGRLGQQTRSRQCVDQNGVPSRTCPGSSTSGRQCTISCANWQTWQTWGQCDGRCGQLGFSVRRRTCSNNFGSQAQNCPGSATSTRRCQMASCARWSEWSDYGSCQASCGATGQQVRSRSCTLNNGSPSNQCTTGSSTSTRFCQGPACPALWANWQSWGSCQLDCTRSRQRNCRVNGQVVSQSRCSGFSSERLQCPGGCPSLDPPNGQSWVSWGSWSGYGICTRTCGGGTQTRYRRCYYLGRSNSPIGSAYCTFTHQTQSSDGRPCRTTPCPNTYTWTNWSPYGQCSSNAPGSCSGRQTSSRRCINPATNQQVQSPNCAPGVDTRTQSCDACQQDNTYGNWYAWGACSAPCHSGSNRPTRVRARCRTGTNCTQQSHWDIVTENCNTNPC